MTLFTPGVKVSQTIKGLGLGPLARSRCTSVNGDIPAEAFVQWKSDATSQTWKLQFLALVLQTDKVSKLLCQRNYVCFQLLLSQSTRHACQDCQLYSIECRYAQPHGVSRSPIHRLSPSKRIRAPRTWSHDLGGEEEIVPKCNRQVGV